MDRGTFAERVRLQLLSRYRGSDVEVDTSRFALHVNGSGIDLMLPLAPLHHACERQPDKVPALIGEYVASVEHQLTPQPAIALSTSRLLWCVRNDRFLALGLSPTTLSEGLLGEGTEVARHYAYRADPSKIIARSVWKAGMETSDDLMTELPEQE